MPKTVLRYFASGLLLTGLVGTAQAAVDVSPQPYTEFYESAARYYSDGDYPTAIIQLKNALQRSPGHVPSRVLLGRAYLRTGDPSSAEKELTLALHYGADETLVLVPLGNALLLQRKHEEILKRVRSLDPVFDASAEIRSIRGQALLELGRLDEAQAAFQSAVAAAPGHPEPLLGLASVYMARHEREPAEKLIDDAARLAPEDEEVWYRKAQVRLMARDDGQASRLLDRTLERNPAHLRARLARGSLRLRLGDVEGALADAEYILGKVPEDAHAALLAAQAEARLGQGEDAQAAFSRAAERIALIDHEFLWRNPSALALAGKVSFVQRDFEKVNLYLSRYLSLRPEGSPLVRKLLGSARIAIGSFDDAAEVLYPLVRAHPTDAEALVLLGDANLKARHYLRASEMFERAAALAADDPKVRLRLAMSRMGAGRTVDALASLEQAFALDSTGMRSGLLLAFVQLRRGEVDKAAATTRELQSRYPDNPLTVNLSGVVKRDAGRVDDARAAFNRALELDPGFEPALFNLADLELREGHPGTATALYRRILEVNPRSARAFVGLSDIERAAGHAHEAINYVKKAIALAPDSVAPYVRLIDHYLGLNETEPALRAARELADRHRENAEVMEELARTQIAAGLRADAIATLREASRYASYSGGVLLRIGDSQVNLGDYEGAAWSYGKAVETDDHDSANVALARMRVRSGDLAGALEFTTALVGREPDNPMAQFIHGEVLARDGRLAESRQAYERSLELSPTSDAIVGLFEVMVSEGEQREAFRRLEDWMSAHPGDLTAKRALGLGYIAANRTDEALAVHEQLLESLPDDPLVLNNLARICQIRKDPRAVAFGERAVAAAPEWPIALDTLGWIHVEAGRLEKGLALLRDAQARAGQNPVIRYHLASALGRLGRRREAVAQLDQILATSGRLAWMAEVKALRASLTGSK